jgi:hypothetical protein
VLEDERRSAAASMSRRRLLFGLGLAILAAGVIATAIVPSRRDERAHERERSPTGPEGEKSAPALASRPADVPPTEDSSPMPAAEAAVRIRGAVTLRREGTRVAGGRVELDIRRPDGEPGSAERVFADVDGTGAYEVELPSGAALLGAIVSPAPSEGMPETFLMTSVRFDESALTADRVVNLEVDPGVVVTGQVRARGSRRPLPNARVALVPVWLGDVWSATDRDGRYALTGIPPTRLRTPSSVEASADGFAAARASLPILKEPTRVEGVDFELEASVRVTGRVTGPDGAVLRGVRVIAWAPRDGDVGLGRRISWLGESALDEDGGFTLPLRLGSGSAHVEVPSANEWGRGFGAGLPLGEIDRAAPQPVTGRLEPFGRLAVGATYPDGRAVAGSAMVVWFVDGRGRPQRARTQGPDLAYVDAAPGTALDLRVHAVGTDGKLPQTFEGRKAVRVPPTSAGGSGYVKTADVVVPLVPRPAPPVEEAWKDVGSCGLDANFAFREFRMTLVDEATGQPLSMRPYAIGLGTSSGCSSSSLREDGRIRLMLGMGRAFLHLEVRGCEPETVLLDVSEPGSETVTVRLRSLR